MSLARPNKRFSTTLYQAADDTQTTLYPNAVPVNVPCYLLLEPKTDKEELVKVTAKSTNSITVIRAQGGTSATDHGIGAALVDFNVPEYFDDLADAYEAVFNDDGTPKDDGVLVTLTGTQTLTNKTLTSPMLNGDLTGDAILDEDDMASDSATKVPTQQSVKAYVDANAGNTDGWTEITDTLTYASATSFTIAGVDRTAVYTKGTRIKLTQTSTKYFVVTSSSFSTNTTVNITAGTDYTLANAAITNPFYSYQANPQGYPGTFNYTPTLTGFSSNPTDVIGHFSVIGNECSVVVDDSGNGTSNSTGKTWSLPITSAGYAGSINVAINNGSQAMANHIVDPTETVVNSYLAPSGTFTNSGGCRLFPNGLRLTYKF